MNEPQQVLNAKRAADGGYWLGLDCGGTKTDLQVVSPSGQVLAELTLGSANPFQQSVTDIFTRLEEGRKCALKLVDMDSSVPALGTVMCVGGLNSEFRSRISELGHFGEVKLLNDPMAVLELCSPSAGAIIHAGTGSFVAARNSFGECKLWGGHGHLLREPASAWDIGRLAVVRALDELEGVETWTEFGRRFQMVHQKKSANELIEFVYSCPVPVTRLAGIAQFVFKMLDRDDPVARGIVMKSFGELAEFAASVLSDFVQQEPEAPRGISGKLFSSPVALTIMKEALVAHGLGMHWTRIEEPPINGVRKILMKWSQRLAT